MHIYKIEYHSGKLLDSGFWERLGRLNLRPIWVCYLLRNIYLEHLPSFFLSRYLIFLLVIFFPSPSCVLDIRLLMEETALLSKERNK